MEFMSVDYWEMLWCHVIAYPELPGQSQQRNTRFPLQHVVNPFEMVPFRVYVMVPAFLPLLIAPLELAILGVGDLS
jgi:hypothetical protein